MGLLNGRSLSYDILQHNIKLVSSARIEIKSTKLREKREGVEKRTDRQTDRHRDYDANSDDDDDDVTSLYKERYFCTKKEIFQRKSPFSQSFRDGTSYCHTISFTQARDVQIITHT